MISFCDFDVCLECVACSLYFIEKMCEFSVVTLELDALYSHEVTFAAPFSHLGSAALVKVTSSCWQQDQSDLETWRKNFVQVLAGELVKNSPFNVNYAGITCLQIFVLHSEIEWMLLAVSLCHRCLFVIIHTLELLHLFKVAICKHLLHL